MIRQVVQADGLFVYARPAEGTLDELNYGVIVRVVQADYLRNGHANVRLSVQRRIKVNHFSSETRLVLPLFRNAPGFGSHPSKLVDCGDERRARPVWAHQLPL